MRNQLDSLARCNINKRGPKPAEPEITSEEIAWRKQLAAIRRANRQSDPLY